MSENLLFGVTKDAVYTGLKIAAPILIASIIIGLLISIFQATTQIQEQTLTFVPKLIGISIIGLVLGNWMLHSIMNFTIRIFDIMVKITT